MGLDCKTYIYRFKLRTQSRIITKKLTHRHITAEFLKTKDREKSLKNGQRKKKTFYEENSDKNVS